MKSSSTTSVFFNFMISCSGTFAFNNHVTKDPIRDSSLSGFDSQSAAKALRNSSGPIEIVLEKDMDANDANGAPPAQAPVETVENEKEDGADNNNCWECIVQ